jgi:hypothetical protein
MLFSMSGARGWWSSSNLGAGVDGVEEGAGVGVPELDGAVGGAAAGGQQVALEGAPRQRLHRSLVARK